MEYPFYADQLRQQYQLLRHKGHFTQMSCIDTNTGKQLSRELLNEEEKVIAWTKKWNGKGNCFIGRNPRDSNGDIQLCYTLSLDMDPIRAKGAAAIPSALAECLSTGKLFKSTCEAGVQAISGNGVLLLFPLRSAVTKDVAERWGRALEERARGLLTESKQEGALNVRIDSTFDAARLCKAMGTISTKGDTSLWRHAKFVDNALPISYSNTFDEWLHALPVESTKSSVFLPPDVSGELDRSKADFALASRLKLQGFVADDAYKALRSFATRPAREDDYKRIIEKVYFGKGNVSDLVSGGSEREIELFTPQSGLAGYRKRGATGTPELPTGFKSIDVATFGLTRGTLFTVGARRGAGKTTFAIGTALNLCRAGKRVLFLSTETTYQEVWDRYFACGTDISAFALQHGFKLNGNQKRLDEFINEFSDKHLLTVYDGSRPNAALVRRIVEQASPDVLIFDYFQHVEARDVKALEEFVMDLHDLAKEKQFAVLMCAQLHDRFNPQTGKSYPPTMNDMKNSKVLNDESRVVVLLEWDSERATGEGPAVVKAVMAKNRGPKTDCLLKLDRAIPKFTDEV